LQPLDVGVFGPFQHAWADRCDEVVEDTGEEIPHEDFIKEYMDVHARTFSTNTISQAFKKCGIHPFNLDIFTDRDFAPSPYPPQRMALYLPRFRLVLLQQLLLSWSPVDQSPTLIPVLILITVIPQHRQTKWRQKARKRRPVEAS
jgi:hypothetical protein